VKISDDSPFRKFFGFTERWASLIAVCCVLILVTIWPPYTNGPPIRSDGVGYHLWTRALLQGNFTFCQWRTELDRVGAISFVDPSRGICQDKFPPGLALLRFPIMAPLVKIDGPLISHGEHEASLVLGAVTLALVCALLLLCSRELGIPLWAAHFSLLAYVFGTGLFHYATYDGSFSHIYSAFVFASLMLLWVRARSGGSQIPPLPLGVIGFFFIAIRNTNVFLIALLLIGDLIIYSKQRGVRMGTRRSIANTWPALVGMAAGLFLQLGYNFYATQTLTISSYGSEHFEFNRPMQWAVLVSYERGLITYYPIVAVALVLGFIVRRSRANAIWFAAILTCFTLIYGFWHSWALGGGFGHRGFVELMPMGVPIFAVSLSELRSRYKISAIVIGILAVFVTIELMSGYWSWTLPIAGTTRSVYWSHVIGKHSLLWRLAHRMGATA
jgi:hypothetical protein